jgi:hypothetical protein
MTLQDRGGSLIDCGGSLAADPDVCCDPCQLCTDETGSPPSIIFVITKKPGATFFSPCSSGLEGTYFYEIDCADVVDPPPYFILLERVFCPGDPLSFIDIGWVPFENPPAPTTGDVAFRAKHASVGIVAGGVGSGSTAVVVDCDNPTGNFDFGFGYNCEVTLGL